MNLGLVFCLYFICCWVVGFCLFVVWFGFCCVVLCCVVRLLLVVCFELVGGCFVLIDLVVGLVGWLF